MLDFSKATRRRKFYLPSGVKLLFLVFPWLFVGYGVTVLQEFVGFYNNSVETSARVVFEENSARRLDASEAHALLEGQGDWPLPAFLYRHEDGSFYVGKPIVQSGSWGFHHGELVTIRYNRLSPEQGQPVTLFKFWWTPGIFIVGGAFASLFLAFAFYLADNPTAKIIPKFKFRKKRPLNLRRR